MTNQIPIAVPMTRMTSRPMMPSSIEVPAKPEAMPVANGLIVEPRTPIPQPEEEDRGANERVVARGDHHRDDEDVERETLLSHAVGRPTDGEDDHEDRDEEALPAPQP